MVAAPSADLSALSSLFQMLRTSGFTPNQPGAAQLATLVAPRPSYQAPMSSPLAQLTAGGLATAKGDGCSGGRGGYSGGGRFRFVSTGANSRISVNIDVTGASIPADSYLVVTQSTNGDALVEVACDDQPTPLGVGGVDVEAIDVANQRAQEQPLQLPATKNVRLTVAFAPGSVAGDVVVVQLWRRGWAVTQGTYCQA